MSSKAGVRPHSASRYHRGRGRSEVAAGDSSCAGYYEDNDYDDEDTEIQSVEDSIHQLSSSLRSSSGNYNRDTSRERDKVQAGFGREEQEGAVSGSSALNPNTNLVHVGAGTTRTSITGTSTGGTSRSRSPSPSLIRHWAEASAPVQEVSTSSQAMLSVPLIDEHSGLLEPTMSIKNRQMYYGVANRRQRFPTHDQVSIGLFYFFLCFSIHDFPY